MRKISPYLLIVLFLAASVLQSCGDPVTRTAASRGKFRMRSWLKYEFRQLKTFSYGNSQVKEKYHVLGFEPSWLIYDSLFLDYPYELLSDLVIGEYDVNPATGFVRYDSSLNAYRDKDIVQVATGVNEDINVLLSVTDYGDFGRRSEFLSEISKKNLINTLDLILDDFNFKRGGGEERDKVGVFMDFPTVPWSLKYEYAEFIARLNKDLDNPEQGKTCLIYAVLPLEEDYNVLYKDSTFAAKMVENVDLFVVRTHNFYNDPAPGVRGPSIPVSLPGELPDLDSLINFYKLKAKIPVEKMVIEMPYYGRYWVNDSTPSGSRPLIPIAEIFNTIETPRGLDTMSLCWTRKVDTTTYFYHDTLSLKITYDWAVTNGLGGIGLYGIGYAHGMDDPLMEQGLWQIIAEHFAEPAPRLLFPGVGFLLCFIVIGIVGSVIVNWQVRYALREKRSRLWYYVALMFFIVLAVVLCALPLEIVGIMWKLISLAIVLFFPLGRKAIKYFFKAAR